LRLLLLLCLLLLTGCIHKPSKKPAPALPPPVGTKPSKPVEDGRPTGKTPDVNRIPEAVPKAEPLSKYGNKSPYTVLGKSYRVLPSSKGFVQRGVASWYGTKFHGQMTSSRERYDMYKFTAAHKSLPIPSYARVTNLENGRSIIVRVNDRGPFAKNRIIDLSYVAAIKLGISGKGTGLVEVRGIDSGSPQRSFASASASKSLSSDTKLSVAEPPAESKVIKSARSPTIYVQIGAFSEKSNAERAATNVSRANLGTVRVMSDSTTNGKIYRVRVGPVSSVETADVLIARLEKLGLGRPHIAIEN